MSCIASALAMQLGELGRRDAPQAAVGPHLVVVDAPLTDDIPGLRERLEPVLVQALVAELAVEALDVAVLHRPARFDQDVADAMLVRPSHEGPAGELRAVVGANGQRVAPKARRLVQHARDVSARDPEVDADLNALVAEVVGHGQTFDAPSAGQAVTDEVHAPDLIDGCSQLQRHALVRRPLGLLAFAHRQLRQPVQALDALVVDRRELRP